MENSLIRRVAVEMLDLSLDEAAAESLRSPLAGVQNFIRIIEGVSMNSYADDFITPGCADAWLENWPKP